MSFIDKIKNYFQKNKLKRLPQAKIKSVSFINSVNSEDFERTNRALGLDNSNLSQRENFIASIITNGENSYKKSNNIDVVNINDIDLNNSYFHFTSASNLEQIINEGLKPQIGDASKLKNEKVPRVYMSKGGKGVIEIKNSFIHELKKLRICDIPPEYRKYFEIKDYSIEQQVDEQAVYDAMEKRFRDEVYFKVDATEDEDFMIEDNYDECFKEDFSIESLKRMFIESPQRDIKGKANHSIETKKLSLIKTDRGNTTLDVVEYLYNRLLENAKKSGKEDAVRWANSDLDGLFEYIRQKNKTFDER